jgi:oxygen-independent coproporphyrinogen-3 oxidase
VQQAIGRIQPFERVRDAVGCLRDAGIDRLNLDLMYGLPRQTVADVRSTASRAAALAPHRLALFGYAHVPWFKPHQRLIDQALLPGAAERIEQARAAAETLEGHGYVPIGLDHFARPDDDLVAAQRSGRLHRNFQGYTSDDAVALIGLGASAIGRLPQGYAQNAVDIGGYSRAIEHKRFATVKGIALSREDRVRAHVIERLMCDFAVDLDTVAGGSGAFAAEMAALAPLADEGAVRIEDGRVTITEQGRPFARLIAAAFDGYLPQNRTRHSIAV